MSEHWEDYWEQLWERLAEAELTYDQEQANREYALAMSAWQQSHI